MNEIKCPNCGEVFTVNESQYSELLSQVRTAEFDREIHARIEQELALAEQKAQNQQQTLLTEKEQEIANLQHQVSQFAVEKELVKKDVEKDYNQQMAEKDQALADLRSQIAQFETQQELTRKEAEQAASQQILAKDKEVQQLENQLATLRLEHENQLQKTLSAVEKERDAAKNQLALQEKEAEIAQTSLKERYEIQLRQKDETIEFYKDFKAKQSTKMIGESLEQHCEYEFNKNRMAMFPRAEFGKDNDARTGSKGDYIYREVDENGVEILSIMFEMKNEGDETATKKKNEHFFKELDKDRNEKKCEYAILVTLLEADSDLYNSGIVDVSYAYEKMYVIRPQFFLPMITLLRNAALNSLQYKQELADMRGQNIDITNFEDDLNAFKVAFAKNYNSASTNFGKAIDEIDKAIKRMEEVKKFLTTSENQLRLANNKLDDVSVKKLTRKNQTMKAKFEALKGE
ncbi:DUF2130 domain-containing protein [Streptococcus panodentis]|uniref:DUF2130 domain-containing protein n=1 Tax=Streptococcus panodentis TaxID=1581472 RepID=A0ABS5AY50_9STRE|nr:DUF2130 domain-containing protein [Streptococcus panodentis]MBP2621465.1 DUF2130 domain-containing protein [Streptococcus panodentis]